MAEKHFSTIGKDHSLTGEPEQPIDKLHQASLLLSRAYAINELMFQTASSSGSDLLEQNVIYSTDTVGSLLEEASGLIDGIENSAFRSEPLHESNA